MPRAWGRGPSPTRRPQHPSQPGFSQESAGSANKGSFKLRLNIPKPRKDKDKMQKQKTNSALPGTACGVAGRETGTAHAGSDPHVLTYPSASHPGHTVEGPSGRATGHVLAAWGCSLCHQQPLRAYFFC